MTDADRCAICNHPDKRDLGTSLAHWRDAPLGMAYEHVVRCSDVDACRRRVSNQGDVWPLVTAKEDRRAV